MRANKAIVTRFFDALNKGDVDFIVDTYAADGCVQTMGNTLISGTIFAGADRGLRRGNIRCLSRGT